MSNEFTVNMMNSSVAHMLVGMASLTLCNCTVKIASSVIVDRVSN